MGRVIDLELNFESLVRFAEKECERGNYLDAILNLNEAMDKAVDSEQKRKLYELYSECYYANNNIQAMLKTAAMEIRDCETSEFFSMSFYDAYPDVDFMFPEDEEASSYKDIKLYNRVITLLSERKYEEGFRTLLLTEPNLDSLNGVLEELHKAIRCDKKFDFDKYTLMFFSVAQEYSNRPEIVALLLEGGTVTRDYVLYNVDSLLEEESSVVLSFYGIIFYKNGEIDAARKFFLKVLKDNPIDEDALYYMTAISLLTENNEERKLYWDRYKESYKILDLPIRTMERLFQSESNVYLLPYMELPIPFMMNTEENIAEKFMQSGLDDEVLKDALDICKFAPENICLLLLNLFWTSKDKKSVFYLISNLMIVPNIIKSLKEKLLMFLIKEGFEEDIVLVNRKRIVKFRLAKLHRRVSKCWQNVYSSVLGCLPFMNFYIPIKCTVLATVIKGFSTQYEIGEEDVKFFVLLTLMAYVKKMQINVTPRSLIIGADIDSHIVEKGMLKFGLETLPLEL